MPNATFLYFFSFQNQTESVWNWVFDITYWIYEIWLQFSLNAKPKLQILTYVYCIESLELKGGVIHYKRRKDLILGST